MSYLKQFFQFFIDIIKSRTLIFELTRRDFKTKYLGSYFGIFWAFVQPTLTILIFWFVFQVGFKSRPVADFPFILWFLAGMIPWFFFTDCVSSATNSIIENSYLVNKVVFRVSILPIIKIITSLLIHIFFILFTFVMFFSYGYPPSIYSLQIIYYVVALTILLLGISWLTSSMVIFLKDISQVVAIVLQFGFWLTPVFWSIDMIPEKYQFLIKLNPLYYIVEGYRNTFIYHKWFWEDMWLTTYFWVVTLVVFAGGAYVFKRLRPHFADVL